MAIILPHGFTSEELRVLQEFRRLNAQVLPLDRIKAIKHPAGAAGEGAAGSLVGKGWLEADASGETFTLTQKAQDLLAIDVRPLSEEEATAPADGAANA